MTYETSTTNTLTLQEYIGSLSEKDQFEVAINLAKASLPIWNDYADNNELSYRDTVVGLTHSVDQQLLQAVIDETVKYLSLNKSHKNLWQLRKQFDDPIVSLQDDDWKLPDSVQKTFATSFVSTHCLEGDVEAKRSQTQPLERSCKGEKNSLNFKSRLTKTAFTFKSVTLMFYFFVVSVVEGVVLVVCFVDPQFKLTTIKPVAIKAITRITNLRFIKNIFC